MTRRICTQCGVAAIRNAVLGAWQCPECNSTSTKEVPDQKEWTPESAAEIAAERKRRQAEDRRQANEDLKRRWRLKGGS